MMTSDYEKEYHLGVEVHEVDLAYWIIDNLGDGEVYEDGDIWIRKPKAAAQISMKARHPRNEMSIAVAYMARLVVEHGGLTDRGGLKDK